MYFSPLLFLQVLGLFVFCQYCWTCWLTRFTRMHNIMCVCRSAVKPAFAWQWFAFAISWHTNCYSYDSYFVCHLSHIRCVATCKHLSLHHMSWLCSPHNAIHSPSSLLFQVSTSMKVLICWMLLSWIIKAQQWFLQWFLKKQILVY